MTTDERELLTPETILLEELDYFGRKIEIFHTSEEVTRWSRRHAHFYASIDGRRSRPLIVTGRLPEDEGFVDPLRKKAKKTVLEMNNDDSLRPSLEGYIAHYGLTRDPSAVVADGFRFDHERAVADFPVGERVVAFGRGCWRAMVVEKIGRTKITLAYVTSRGGQITRANALPSEIGVAR